MGTLICGLLMTGIFLGVIKVIIHVMYQPLFAEQNDGFIKKLLLHRKQQENANLHKEFLDANLHKEFLDANQKRGADHGYLTEHILRIMRQNSDEFNEAGGHDARMQFILEVLEFKPEFANQNEFQKSFIAAMNMYVPGEMKKRTGKGGLGMTYSYLSLNEEFAKAKEQRKLLTKV
jgi:hypothetical protein